MRCEEIMKHDVKTCGLQDPVFQAARSMREDNVGFLPICDDSRNVQGTLTDRDIVIRVVADNRPLDTPCSEVMSKEVYACVPSDDVQRAIDLMTQHHIARVMCIEQGKLVGVISLSDIAQKETDQRVAHTVRGVTQREAATPLAA